MRTVAEGPFHFATWAPDGSGLFFVRDGRVGFIGDGGIDWRGDPEDAMLVVPATLGPYAVGRRDGTIRISDERILRAHDAEVTSLEWSPGDQRLLTSSIDHTIQIWDVGLGRRMRLRETHNPVRRAVFFENEIVSLHVRDVTVPIWSQSGKLLRELRGHTGEVTACARRGSLLVTGSTDRTVRIWREPTAVLEAHTAGITSISISHDGEWIASLDTSGRILLWHVSGWLVGEAQVDNWLAGIEFHPTQLLLCAYGSSLLQWSLRELRVRAPRVKRHATAKVVLVGESNVGKSCLALRFAEDRFEEQRSTHGLRFWPLPVASPDGEAREIVLWDLGGQDEYRLVHQLFLDDTQLALVLVDPTRGRSAFAEVAAWNRRLEGRLRPGARKFLVGTKRDEGDSIDDPALERLVREGGFDGYFPTSAKSGLGCAALREAIFDALDWSRIVTTSRSEPLQRVRDAVEEKRRAGAPVVIYDEMQRALAADGIDGRTFATAVEQLEQSGALCEARLATGELALVLRIDHIERYAGSLILLARSQPRGVPAVEERLVGAAQLALPGMRDEERLPRLSERIVLECVVQLLLKHEICLQHEGLLLFPSLFTPSESDAEAPMPAASLYYAFGGAIDNLWASLVASLALSETFGRMRLWEGRAEFAHPGRPAMGLRKVDRGGGLARVDVYFEEPIDAGARDLFLSFVEQQLKKYGIELREHLELACSNCGYRFSDEILRRRVAEGADDVGCPSCDTRLPLVEGVDRARARDPQLERRTWALRAQVAERRQRLVDDAGKKFERRLGDRAAPLRLLLLGALGDEVPPLPEGGRFDAVISTGNSTRAGTPAELERARQIISTVLERVGSSAARFLLVPGPSDVDRAEEVYAWRGRRPGDTDGLVPGSFVAQPLVLGLRLDEKYPLRFRSFSRHLYHPLLQRAYPLAFAEQVDLLALDDDLTLLGLNSAWQVDEFHPARAGVHPDALARALAREAPPAVVVSHALPDAETRARLRARLFVCGEPSTEPGVVGVARGAALVVELARGLDHARVLDGDRVVRELDLDGGTATRPPPPPLTADGFDVFLAHSSRDKPLVRRLGELLRARGLKPWLDEEQLPPGRFWSAILQKALVESRAAAICIGPDGLGPWTHPESHALLARYVEAQNPPPVIPVLLPGAQELPPDLPFLRLLQYVRFLESVDEPGPLDNLVWGITGVHPRRP